MLRPLTITLLFVALVIPACGQINGIPASVTSLGPFGFTGPFGGPPIIGNPALLGGFRHGVFFNGGFGFGHNPRFGVFVGNGFRRFHHRGFFGGQFFGTPFAPVLVGSGGGYPVVVVQNPQGDEEDGYAVRGRRERLSRDELRRMIAEELADAREGEEARRRATEAVLPQAQAKPAAPEPERPATVLVFKDGHRQEVRNYAIMDSVLYEFAGVRKKIPLADLDLDATVKTNDERGVRFNLPSRPKAKK